MRKKNFLKLFSLLVLSVLVISTVGGVYAFRGYVTEFRGASHGSCHGPRIESENGTITGTANPATPYTNEEFILTVVVHNFTEPYIHDIVYENYTLVGLSGVLGDNSAFMRHLNSTMWYTSLKVNESGYVDNKGGEPLEFDLIAPDTAGSFEIVVAAIVAANHSQPHGVYQYYNLTYALGSIFITVLPSPDVGGAIAGNILIITVGSISVISAVLILKMKKRWKKKER